MIIWIIVIAIIVIFFVITIWLLSKGVADALTDIRHGKGIFLTFDYTFEEWEYYTQTFPFRGQTGKVCFTRNHIYISDGTEELLYEIFRLRKISLEAGFIIFTVRIKEFSPSESGKFTPDNPDNLKDYQILIPNDQRQRTDDLIDFYEKVIDKYDRQQRRVSNK